MAADSRVTSLVVRYDAEKGVLSAVAIPGRRSHWFKQEFTQIEVYNAWGENEGVIEVLIRGDEMPTREIGLMLWNYSQREGGWKDYALEDVHWCARSQGCV
jgi:hypothetical protein